MKSVVLLSGGLDSSVCLAYAVTESKVDLALTFNYGQRAAEKEILAAARLAKYYNVKHLVIDLPWLAGITSTALMGDSQVELPEPTDSELDDFQAANNTAAAVWVPNRNGLFVNIGACYAESLDCRQVITGFNREEAVTFPDNTPEFVQAASVAMSFSTANQVKVLSYTGRLDKSEIVALGQRLGLPWKLIWSCYRNQEKMCGKCESCKRLIRAFKTQGIDIPSGLVQSESD